MAAFKAKIFWRWRRKRQYPNKSHQAANRLRTRRRQLCIKWQIDARGISFHIRWTSKRKSATLRTMVLGFFYHCLMQHHAFSIRFNQNFCFAMQSKTSTMLAAAGPWYSQCTTCILQRVVVKLWLSLSVEDRGKIPPRGHDCPECRPMVVCNYGKGTTIPWWKRLRRHIVAGHRLDGEAWIKGRSLTPSGFAL